MNLDTKDISRAVGHGGIDVNSELGINTKCFLCAWEPVIFFQAIRKTVGLASEWLVANVDER